MDKLFKPHPSIKVPRIFIFFSVSHGIQLDSRLIRSGIVAPLYGGGPPNGLLSIRTRPESNPERVVKGNGPLTTRTKPRW